MKLIEWEQWEREVKRKLPLGYSMLLAPGSNSDGLYRLERMIGLCRICIEVKFNHNVERFLEEVTEKLLETCTTELLAARDTLDSLLEEMDRLE